MTFTALGLNQQLQRALTGYPEPTPIQKQAIPLLLQGKDLLGIAQTGTGKTAAFVLPTLQLLAYHKPRPRALILAPTRELATQIGESISKYGKFMHVRHTVIFGGVGQGPQVMALRKGVDIIVATPGRLLDLIQQRHAHLDAIEILILDEADRMLDMGFIHDIRKIRQLITKKHQTLLFSATMSKEVERLVHSTLTRPERIEVTPQATTVERIRQHVLFVDRKDKDALLADLLKQEHLQRVLVFTRTKHGADKVARKLAKEGIRAGVIHGNKTQSARQSALKNFQTGRSPVLIATDIAARGIDVKEISHVINFDLPSDSENYVHRIGRTARAGEEGTSYSFCSGDERETLRAIEKTIREKIPVMEHAYHSHQAAAVSKSPPKSPPKKFAQRRKFSKNRFRRR